MNQQQQLPAVVEREVQRRLDSEHLRLLSIFYYIQAGVSGLVGLYGILYIFLGLFGGSVGRPGEIFPTAMFVIMGAAILVVGLAMAAGNFVAGRSLTRRQNLVLLQVVAGLSCLNMPYGTALGVLTFMVLGRPSVKALFEGRDPYGEPLPTEPESGNWYRSQGGNGL